MKNFNKFNSLLILAMASALPACTHVHEKEMSVIEYVNDDDILDRVAYNISQDPLVSRFEISISVSRNKVRLRGFVDSNMARKRAEELALKVVGVISVKNDLVIRTSGDRASVYFREY